MGPTFNVGVASPDHEDAEEAKPMLMMRTAPVLVTEYGTYVKDDKTTPMTRRDGSPVEFVDVQVEGEERTRRYTLDATVNGGRAAVGSRVELVLETRQTEEARLGQSGRPFIKRDVKSRVLAFEPAGK